MKKYNVTLSVPFWYGDIEAESEERAVEIAKDFVANDIEEFEISQIDLVDIKVAE